MKASVDNESTISKCTQRYKAHVYNTIHIFDLSLSWMGPAKSTPVTSKALLFPTRTSGNDAVGTVAALLLNLRHKTHLHNTALTDFLPRIIQTFSLR